MKKTTLQFPLLLLGVFLLFYAIAGAAPPDTICIQGALQGSDGRALTGERFWRVQFYNAEIEGDSLGAATTGTLRFSASGRFSIDLAPPIEALAPDGPLWYELAIDSALTSDSIIDESDIFPKRVAVHSVLFAQRANTSVNADQALSADFATTATFAQTAAQADFATTATFAQTATRADTAVSAESANTAATADRASTATYAITAKHAYTAAFAALADVATWASDAGSAYILRGEAFVMVRADASPTLNATNLQAAYAKAKTLTPHEQALSATNRAALIVLPGRYDFAVGSLNLNAEFVDLIGLTTDRSIQHITGEANGPGTGVLMQSANDVRIENLTVEYTGTTSAPLDKTHPTAYFPDTRAHRKTVVRNCQFLSTLYSMRVGVEYAGTYKDCAGGIYAFGGNDGTASGIFIDCSGGSYSFGGLGGTASGIFDRCVGGLGAFGGLSAGVADGKFTNCTGGDYSFGGLGGLASGAFTNCVGEGSAFGGNGGTASGKFTYCVGGKYAFAGNGGTAPGGKFYHCEGGATSFTTDAADGAAPVHLFCIRSEMAFP